MGLSLNGLGIKGIGSFLNNFTGATSAGELSQKYAIQSAGINNIYQKEFAKNAHQWEVEDMQKAGLNPLLSAGGGGASASGGGVASGNVTGSGINPMDILSAGVNTINQIHTGKQIQAQTENTTAQTLYTKAQTQMELLEYAIKSKMAPEIINKLKADLALTQEQTKLIQGGKVAQIAGTKPIEEAGNTIDKINKKNKNIVGIDKNGKPVYIDQVA